MDGGQIVVIGSTNVDLVTTAARMPAAGETLTGTGFSIGHGGKGANQAVAAARLGGAVALVSRVGDDDFAAGARRALERAGVDTRHVLTSPGLPTGVATILVEPDGENRIVIVRGANGAIAPADVDAAAATIAAARLVLLQLEIPPETVFHAIEAARRAGVEVLLNPAPALAGLDVARLAGVRFLVPNETELALLTGLPTDTEAACVAAARTLNDRGIGTVIVTRGAEGALMVEAGHVRAVPGVAVNPVDTTGAGDAFIGAFARYYAGGLAPEQALARAAAYAALTVTRPGAQDSYPDAAAFAAFSAAIASADK